MRDLNVRIFQKGFNYSQDGEGNRLVYHLQGCNMRCPWCANPEGMFPEGSLMVDEEQLLDSACPYKAVENQKLCRDKCKTCIDKACIKEFTGRGIQCSYKEYSIEEILKEIKSCKSMFYDGGGVTFTGGEPTVQFNALKTLLEFSKISGVNTAIESNASNPNLPGLFAYIDHLILDFKHYDNQKHLETTGISNDVIKRNLTVAFKAHPHLHIRIPLIGGFNSSPEDAEHFAQFFCRQDTENATFEVLPYHEYGKIKWQQCGRDYLCADSFVSPKTVRTFEEVFKEHGLNYLST